MASYSERVLSGLNPKKIQQVVKNLVINKKYVEYIGEYKAKISANILDEKLAKKKQGALVIMTSITPTHYGEGKSVSTIGLSMALNKGGKKSIACLSQGSLGGLFSLKGSSTGGGYSQLYPAVNANIGLNGDFYYVNAAQNLCAAAIDNEIFWNAQAKISKDLVNWKRAVEINDRALRNVSIGGGGKLHGVSRRTGDDIVSACESMAILGLSTSLKDLRKRLDNAVVGYTAKGHCVTAHDLGVSGAMAIMLKEASSVNLLQTTEGTPCFVHGGSMGNIADSSPSVMSQLMASKMSNYAVVETDFGADIGAEKYFNIKARNSGLEPTVAVVNCSIRSLKLHSGDFTKKGIELPREIKREDLSSVDRGCSNLEKQVENLKMYGIPIVVSINRFDSDTKKEIDVVIRRAEALGVEGIAVNESYSMGSEGAKELAEQVVDVCKKENKFRYLYPLDMSIKNKIERVSKSMYGASEVRYSDDANKSLEIIEHAGYGKLPVCMAKTYLSLSTNSKKKGRPRGFALTVDQADLAAGAGYVSVKCDGISSIPGMVSKPRYQKMDFDPKNDRVKGII